MCIYTHIVQQYRDTGRAKEIKNTGSAVNAACHWIGSPTVPYQFLCIPFTLTATSAKQTLLPRADHCSSADDVHTVQQGCPTCGSQGTYLWPSVT